MTSCRMRAGARAAAGLALWLGGCEGAPRADGLIQEARLGVFFGGQIQQREEVARVFDETQSQGFRIVFREPLPTKKRVRWELVMPPRPGSGEVLVSKLGELTVPAGQRQIDQAFRFEPGDPLGLWNIRVLVDDELVIDRAWLVFDAVARRQAEDER
ncbi:MAG TPA: hypothetical protein VFU02_08365 [Polyangiaceae bacterium]|nr:hypothetical protein [Polyangiaceae bacterium]